MSFHASHDQGKPHPRLLTTRNKTKLSCFYERGGGANRLEGEYLFPAVSCPDALLHGPDRSISQQPLPVLTTTEATLASLSHCHFR